MYLRSVIQNPNIMNPGKNRCEYLKAVRRRIATENGIPLEQRECTFKGECSGTCPFCEAEMRYLEKELRRRKALGKAVTVAGIALSSVMLFPACGPKNTLQGEPELPPEPDTTLTVADTVPTDTIAELVPPPPPSPNFPDEIVCGEIILYSDLGFPPEYGTPQQWFNNQLQDSGLQAKIKEYVHDAVSLKYSTDDKGFVESVSVYGLPTDSVGKEIKEELKAILFNMPQWDTAKTVSTLHRFKL